MPAEPASAAQARRFLRQLLGTWGCEPLEETAALLLSELVANSLLHAKSEVHVSVLLMDDVLRVEVADDSPRMPRRRRYGLDATTGRGLSLVAEMARDWGSRRRGAGKVVWFEVGGSSPALERRPMGSTGGAAGAKDVAPLPPGAMPGTGLGDPRGRSAPDCLAWPRSGQAWPRSSLAWPRLGLDAA